MTIIFKVKFSEGYAFKTFIETLSHNIKTGCFEIDEKGISICTTDAKKVMLVNGHIDTSVLSGYKFSPTKDLRYYDPTTKKMYLGITTTHFFEMLSPVKKKDALELFIDDEEPMLLQMRLISANNNYNPHSSISDVTIQAIRELQPDIPTGYRKLANISSSEYQKMIKSMMKIRNTISISSIGGQVTFSCKQEGTRKRREIYGDAPEADDVEITEAEYSTTVLCRLSKLSGLSSTIQVFPGLPLKFKCFIGSKEIIGYIEFYIKSNKELEDDKRALEELEYESD